MNYVGDKDCINNAMNSRLRCAVNPSGPCTNCQHFEKVSNLESVRRRYMLNGVWSVWKYALYLVVVPLGIGVTCGTALMFTQEITPQHHVSR